MNDRDLLINETSVQDTVCKDLDSARRKASSNEGQPFQTDEKGIRSRRRSFREEKEATGTVLSSVLNLANTIIGAGLLGRIFFSLTLPVAKNFCLS